MTYAEFRNQVKVLLAEGKTSGYDHTESMMDYTRLNDKRMDRLDKTLKLSNNIIQRLKEIPTKQHWIVLVEAWCGDVAQNLPVLVKMAEQNTNIALRIIYRDENPEVMERYLTNGSRSIPKLIILDENLSELATWGPRPKPVQEMLAQFKNNPEETYQDYAVKAHSWYAKDKNKTIQEEFTILLDSIITTYQKVA